MEFVGCQEEVVTAAELIVSELVSNAGAGSSSIELEVLRADDIVRATITDGGAGCPVPKNPGRTIRMDEAYSSFGC